MESGFEIFWTDHALSELADAYDYLELHFTEIELNNLSNEIDNTQKLISQNPKLFPISEFPGIRMAVIKRFNTMYFRVKRENVEILSFFSNRQDPEKRKV